MSRKTRKAKMDRQNLAQHCGLQHRVWTCTLNPGHEGFCKAHGINGKLCATFPKAVS